MNLLRDVRLLDAEVTILLDTEPGRVALAAYYEPYLAIGRRLGVPVMVDTPTWRANLDWIPELAPVTKAILPSNDPTPTSSRLRRHLVAEG